MRSPKPEGTASARHSLPQGESHPERTEGRPRGAKRQDLGGTRKLPEPFGAHACSSLPGHDEQQTDSKLRARRTANSALAHPCECEQPDPPAGVRARPRSPQSATPVLARATEPTSKPPSDELRGRITFDMSGMTQRAKPAVACPLDGGVRSHVAAPTEECIPRSRS